MSCELICPKVPLETFVFGEWNKGELNAFKASALNCALAFSVMLKFLKIDKSQFF